VPDKFWEFNKRVDRRRPHGKRDENSPILRENLLARDGRLTLPKGTTKAITTQFTSRVHWMARYNTIETGQVSPKTFAYTKDGKLWILDEANKTATEIKNLLNENAYPESWMIKQGTATFLYFVDGKNLYKYDGNNDNMFQLITITDTDGNSINPIDNMEHSDRQFLISKNFVYVSKNLGFEVFDDSTDSIQIVVGSGKGENLALQKIEGNLYIFNTEGIFVLVGDVISAVASTFTIALIEERNIVAGRTARKVEKAILFLAATDKDIELWSFDGVNTKMLSHSEKLSDSINTKKVFLEKAVAHYYNNYYMVSFVENQKTDNNLEFWWDALRGEGDIIRDRNVSCYVSSDPTVEEPFMLLGRSDTNYVMRADNNRNFDGEPVQVRLITGDVTLVNKGKNARITEFFPFIEATGDLDIQIRYKLDGRLSDLDEAALFNQSLEGESKALGLIKITNQQQFIDRVLPKIKYSLGETIAFEISSGAKDMEFSFLGIGLNRVDKGDKKGKKVGA